jgi:hypothetical protein
MHAQPRPYSYLIVCTVMSCVQKEGSRGFVNGACMESNRPRGTFDLDGEINSTVKDDA